MFRVHVFFNVKPEYIESFKVASIENVAASRLEEGVVAFDIIALQEDETQFVFEETYVSGEAQLKHRETPHFKKWKATILPYLVEDYTFKKYDVVF